MDANEYISLEAAKKHLNIDINYHDDDELIRDYINNAISIVLEDSCNTIDALVDNSGALKGVAKQAIMLKLGDLYAYRESVYNGGINEVPGGYDRLIKLIRNYQ